MSKIRQDQNYFISLQITEIKNTLGDIGAILGDFNNEINSIKGDISNINSSIIGINNRISNNETEIDNIISGNIEISGGVITEERFLPLEKTLSRLSKFTAIFSDTFHMVDVSGNSIYYPYTDLSSVDISGLDISGYIS